ncbi:MAG TPA: PIG-L family deacetylase [Pyrinomonadaceae bacterium]|nr:PIG-L family deacetylase [Pyrinomonadaceae bacterium]
MNSKKRQTTNKLNRAATTAAALLFLLLLSAPARAQRPASPDAAETEAALRKLTVAASVLYVGAHPDDENTALLAYLARGRRVRTAYLSLTRGDGGQNLLGTEKGEMLGVVRTQELLAARRVDGAEQFFTRAIDFGFTKSPEETFRFWDHDAVLADVVWVIRRFRPDVIITRFPTTGEGGHGQHTASAILAGEAFDAAGDPSRFPEQLRQGVTPWKPKRLLWNVFNFGGATPKDADRLLKADVGGYDPLLGKSYTEIAAESRTQHKSQGQGTPERRGAAPNFFSLIKGEPASKDIFDGVDMTWRRFAGGEAVGQLLEEAASKYDAANPAASLPLLLRARRELDKLPKDEPLLEAKRAALAEVIRDAAGLWVEAVAAEPYVTPGGEVKVTTTIVNRSGTPLRLETVGASSAGVDVLRAELKSNEPLSRETTLRVPVGAEYSQPYWLRETPVNNLFRIEDHSLLGAPEGPPALSVPVNVIFGEDAEAVRFQVPVQYRWTDRVNGDMYRPVVVVPEVAVSLEEKTLVFPDRQPKQVRVILRDNTAADASGNVRLRLPAGWTSSPAEASVTLKGRGEELRASFNVTPPAGASVAALDAEFVSGGKTFTQGVTEIDYPHIPRQTLFPEAEAKLVRVDLQRKGQHIGYVMGSGDEVPEALRQVGYDVTLLSDEDLEAADLSRFDAVVTGVRAYNTRAALRRQQARLLQYVERGGTLVVQYNTPDRTLEGAQLGPFPFKLTQDRVTDETAPLTMLAPADALLNAPNKITPADFQGWVQERGLYFASDWDARYTPLFESHDPGSAELRGSTLVARQGKGTYVFTALAFFRQLPAGVPGAYRLFANMISAGK